jgi:acetate kinase
MSAVAAGPPVVLAVNSGSSSLKFGLYAAQGPALWTGVAEGLEPGGAPRFTLDGRRAALAPRPGQGAFEAALERLDAALRAHGAPLCAVAHRIVHGGERCVAPQRLDAQVLAYLRTLAPLAPLHQPHNLDAVDDFARAFPGVPQIGCFDTAFHASLPDVERRLTVARSLAAQGLRRYGFHGLSYTYLSQVLAERTPRAAGRAVLAHLGNGASLCATRAGRSVATTMGFSALDGLMMGTRSGAVDPGVLLYLWRAGWSCTQVEDLLYRQSGLKGVSGLSADLRSLRASAEPAAREAIDLFTHRVRCELGAMLAVLGGAELIAFTGGIGEHDAVLRAEVIASLGFAGIVLDAAANRAADGTQVSAVHAPGSTAEIWVVPTDEGRVAARAAFELLARP